MANALHSAQTVADGIHILHSFEYLSVAARTGATGLLPTDVGKVAQQTVAGVNTYWILTDDSPVTWIQLGGAASGEANTGSSLGSGEGNVFKTKTGVDLEFRSIKQGANITITEDANEITINAPAGAGEANTATNEGTAGVGPFETKTGVNLEFRNINPLNNKVSVALDAPNKNIDVGINEGNIVHQNLNGAGTNTHAQIDTHVADTNNPHDTSIANIDPGTLAQLNGNISDATLIDTGDSRLSDSRTPTGAAGGDLGGTYPNPTVNDGADSTAIHDNVSGEINAIALKATPVNADVIVIEDSADGFNKKRTTLGSLPGGGGAPSAPIDEIVNEHFAPNNLDLDEIGRYGWRTSKTGTQSDTMYIGVPGHPGTLRLEAGTGTTGRASVFLGQLSHKGLRIGGNNAIMFEAVIRVTGSVANGELEYLQMGLGFDDWEAAGLLNDAVIVRGVGGGTFQVMCSVGGSASVSNGTTTIALNTWYRVGFVVSDPGGTPSVQLYVNGVAEGTPVTTNIPTAVDLLPGMKIDSDGGATSPTLDVDRYLLTQTGDEED